MGSVSRREAAIVDCQAAYGCHLSLANFLGALLGLRLVPDVLSAIASDKFAFLEHELPDAVGDCFVQLRTYLSGMQAIAPQRDRLHLAGDRALLSAVPMLLRYRGEDLLFQRQIVFPWHDEMSALCLVLSDLLSVPSTFCDRKNWSAWISQIRDRSERYKLSPEQAHQYISLWNSIFSLLSLRLSDGERTMGRAKGEIEAELLCDHSTIHGVVSALIHQSNYTVAVMSAARYGDIAPWIAGLIVGNWVTPAALPLRLQLQIDLAGQFSSVGPASPVGPVSSKVTAHLLSRSDCQKVAKILFDQWAGRAAEGNRRD